MVFLSRIIAPFSSLANKFQVMDDRYTNYFAMIKLHDKTRLISNLQSYS